MNTISRVHKYIVDKFDGDVLVNTVSILPTRELDNNIHNIYPLVNVDITNTFIDIQVVTLTFNITVVQQRDVIPKTTDNKLLNDTNFIDNLNETHSICEKFINSIRNLNNLELVEVVSVTSLTPLKLWNRSDLDGFQFSIELSTPNDGYAC